MHPHSRWTSSRKRRPESCLTAQSGQVDVGLEFHGRRPFMRARDCGERVDGRPHSPWRMQLAARRSLALASGSDGRTVCLGPCMIQSERVGRVAGRRRQIALDRPRPLRHSSSGRRFASALCCEGRGPSRADPLLLLCVLPSLPGTLELCPDRRHRSLRPSSPLACSFVSALSARRRLLPPTSRPCSAPRAPFARASLPRLLQLPTSTSPRLASPVSLPDSPRRRQKVGPGSSQRRGDLTLLIRA
jgi:hypothetical protein